MVRIMKTRPADAFVSYTDDDGEPEVIRFSASEHRDPLDIAFGQAAYTQAFSDIANISRVRVHHQGRVYYYAGWQPGMKIEFVNQLGVSIWCERFPRWDH